MWCHGHGSGLVVWDYHVLAMGCTPAGEAVIFDLDSSLPFPCSVVLWTQRALLVDSDMCKSQQLKRQWRVVQASQFLAHFASDRSHMIKEVTVNEQVRYEWSSPPPPYNCISTPESSNNLPQYLDMAQSSLEEPSTLAACHESKYGVLMQESIFLRLILPNGD